MLIASKLPIFGVPSVEVAEGESREDDDVTVTSCRRNTWPHSHAEGSWHECSGAWCTTRTRKYSADTIDPSNAPAVTSAGECLWSRMRVHAIPRATNKGKRQRQKRAWDTWYHTVVMHPLWLRHGRLIWRMYTNQRR